MHNLGLACCGTASGPVAVRIQCIAPCAPGPGAWPALRHRGIRRSTGPSLEWKAPLPCPVLRHFQPGCDEGTGQASGNRCARGWTAAWEHMHLLSGIGNDLLRPKKHAMRHEDSAAYLHIVEVGRDEHRNSLHNPRAGDWFRSRSGRSCEISCCLRETKQVSLLVNADFRKDSGSQARFLQVKDFS